MAYFTCVFFAENPCTLIDDNERLLQLAHQEDDGEDKGKGTALFLLFVFSCELFDFYPISFARYPIVVRDVEDFAELLHFLYMMFLAQAVRTTNGLRRAVY